MTSNQNSSDDDEPAFVGRAQNVYRVYSWGNWIRRIWTWLTTASPGTAAVGVGATAVVLTTAALTLNDARQSMIAAERLAVLTIDERPRPAEREALGADAVVYAIRGRDRAGRSAEFDVIVLARDFHWIKGSHDRMERGGQPLDGEAFVAMLAGQDLGRRLAQAIDIIAVGLASAEGERAAEEARARQRGQQMAAWITAATRGTKTVWVLDLGQHLGGITEADSPDTDWQRPILIIGLRKAEAGVVLEEALASAMNGATNLPKTTSYSRFSLTKKP